MAFRKRLSRNVSRRLFHRTAGARHVHKKNNIGLTVPVMRGGIRL